MSPTLFPSLVSSLFPTFSRAVFPTLSLALSQGYVSHSVSKLCFPGFVSWVVPHCVSNCVSPPCFKLVCRILCLPRCPPLCPPFFFPPLFSTLFPTVSLPLCPTLSQFVSGCVSYFVSGFLARFVPLPIFIPRLSSVVFRCACHPVLGVVKLWPQHMDTARTHMDTARTCSRLVAVGCQRCCNCDFNIGVGTIFLELILAPKQTLLYASMQFPVGQRAREATWFLAPSGC